MKVTQKQLERLDYLVKRKGYTYPVEELFKNTIATLEEEQLEIKRTLKILKKKEKEARRFGPLADDVIIET